MLLYVPLLQSIVLWIVLSVLSNPPLGGAAFLAECQAKKDLPLAGCQVKEDFLQGQRIEVATVSWTDYLPSLLFNR
jgi:hypothetical protein